MRTRRVTGAEVEVAETGLEAVAVGDVDIDDVGAGGADGGGDVGFLDVHVEEVGHDHDLRAGLLGEGAAISLAMFPVLFLVVIIQLMYIRRVELR